MKECAQRKGWLLPATIVLTLILGASLGEARRGPVIRVLSPQPEEIVAGPDVVVHVEVDGLDLRPGCNSLHLQLDNEPFAVKYRVDQPYRFHDVAPGTHTLRVYAANPYHEIIPGTLNVIPFAVEYHDGQNRPECGEPLLTYVLPQGEYRGIDCADILLNFEVSGAPLSRYGYRVQYYVDGRRFLASTRQSQHLKGLTPGYHTVRMELIDEKGRIVPGPFNVVERTILLSPDKSLDQPEKGLSPYLSSIQGPMTGGRLWVSRGEKMEAEQAPTKVPHETDARKDSKRREEISVVTAESTKAKEPALEEDFAATPQETQRSPSEESAPPEQQSEPADEAISKPAAPAEKVPAPTTQETTPIVRARRVPLGQFRNVGQTTATLKATNVSSTQTQFIRMTSPSVHISTSTKGLQGSREAKKDTSVKKSDVTSRAHKHEASQPEISDEKQRKLSKNESLRSATPRETTTTTTLFRSIERVIGVPGPVEIVERIEDDMEQAAQQGELTATISRVVSSQGVVTAYEVIKE